MVPVRLRVARTPTAQSSEVAPPTRVHASLPRVGGALDSG